MGRFKAIVSRYRVMTSHDFDTYEEAVTFLQVGAEYGEHYGHAIYDEKDKVFYRPDTQMNDDDGWLEEKGYQVAGVERGMPLIVAGYYPTFYPLDDD